MLAFVDLISLHVFYLLPKTEGHAAVMPEVAYVEYNQKVHTMQSCTFQTGAEAILHPIKISQYRKATFFVSYPEF